MSNDSPDLPQPLTEQDLALFRNLAAVREVRQHFYENLNSSIRAIFSHCEWRITHNDNGLAELVVVCPNMAVYKRLRSKAEILHSRFRDTVNFSHTRFCLYYPQSPDAFYEHEINSMPEWSDWWFFDDDEQPF